MSASIYLTFLCTFIALQGNSGFKVPLDAKKRAIENTAVADAILYAYRIDADAPNFLNRGDLIFNVDRDKDVSILHNSEMKTSYRYSDSEHTVAQNIAASMKVAGNYGAFSGSASMEMSSSSNKNTKTIRIDSMIKSVEYEVSAQGAFRTFPERFLTDNFKETVERSSVEQLAEIVGIFFATKLDLGGEIMKSYTMEATEEDTEMSVKAELQAEYKSALMGASVEASGSYASRKNNKESKVKISWSAQGGKTNVWLGRTFSDKGSNSVASIQEEWAASITDRNMYPTNFELRPMWDLVKAVDAKKGAEFQSYLEKKWDIDAKLFKPTDFLKVCSAGEYLRGEECVKCAAGEWSEGGSATSCESCPADKWSLEGTTKKDDCYARRYCAWSDKTPCDKDTGCTYGCHNSQCWSQCDGSCPHRKSGCNGCKEWCYLRKVNNISTRVTCSAHGECRPFRGNKCSGSCTV